MSQSPSPLRGRSASRKRVLAFAIGTSSVIGLGTVGYVIQGMREADALVQRADARLHAPFVEAPGVDRVQASGAAAMLEQAMDMGRNEDAVRGTYHYARALEDLQRGDLVLAEGELSSAHQFLGETVDLVILSAALSRARLLHEDAEREITHALELSPDEPRALLLAADIALDLDHGREARAHLEHLSGVVPDSSTVHNRLGVALEEEGDYEGAERELREAARIDRQGHDAWVNLGRVLRRADRHVEAREAFDIAVQRAPSDPDALLGRGLTRAATSDVRGAEADFRRAAELAPNDAEPLLALGDLQRDLGAVSDAVTTYRAAIDREDADAASWLKLGNALALLEDYTASAHAFEAAIRRSPELAAAHNGLGASLMHLSDEDPTRRPEAVLALERAFELDPSDPNPLMNLALLAERDGVPDAARSAWERVLEVWPGSPIATRRLARLQAS
ncbi:MAG: tetratricopeptide repeat protein [Deltaproteobacteria bacterium]|nr:tetratricopeptide repeat protein [Deltaproteobacteria bacterium]